MANMQGISVLTCAHDYLREVVAAVPEGAWAHRRRAASGRRARAQGGGRRPGVAVATASRSKLLAPRINAAPTASPSTALTAATGTPHAHFAPYASRMTASPEPGVTTTDLSPNPRRVTRATAADRRTSDTLNPDAPPCPRPPIPTGAPTPPSPPRA